MTINKSNFEAYLLDYLEGNLDPLLTADLMAFLAENPEYENFMPDNARLFAPADTITFEEKTLLKKDYSNVPAITPENFDEFCIAACEGLLTPAGTDRLTAFIGDDPVRIKELVAYKKIKLQPDLSVRFSHKDALKKAAGRTFQLHRLYTMMAVAASIALVVWLAIKIPGGAHQQFAAPVTVINNENEGKPLTPVALSGNRESTPALVSQNIIPPRPVNKITYSGAAEQPPPVRETLMLSAIDPLSGASVKPVNTLQPLSFVVQKMNSGHPLTEEANATKTAGVVSKNLLHTLLAKVDFWKTAKTAIQGFNYLTESQLSIDKTTDENGKISGLLLSMESYTISGSKIK
jgi:hypothetical protein